MGQEKIGEINENAVKAMGAFGGGIASSGNVCGILIGAIAIISSIYSRGNLQEKEDPKLWAASSRFLKKFEALTASMGSINCCDIAKVDWKNRDEVKNYYSNPESSRKVCIKLVGDAAYELGELIDRYSEKE